ncbi:CPBP family intramembrane glutamic endopeptidase [Tichowtungia aerotolerans]|uniref:CPBP family intramembrane metalloprotease n=1 Tax=Tichowtungia aerotolerans TaxID=2697043 RepID=A0A6P1M3H4_9BACT|nr:CPBP family intramembrane glutamic endopeptidase [Tichowtungia aerotolerans]QHI68652.1 CPBP family intramembrane metalloprotease [Tichowtungia aerotolerans]
MNRDRFKPLFALLLIFCAAPLLAALVSPWIYMAVQSRAAEVMQWVHQSEAAGTNLFWADIADSVFTSPFRRVNDRIVLILVLGLLAPAYRLSGMGGRADFGIPKRRDWLRLFGIGLIVAAASMLIVYAIGLFAGVYGPVNVDGDVVSELLKIIIGMLLIGVIEEILFRGFILTAFRKSFGPVAAVLLSSALFAAVHFIKPAEPEITNRWFSGFLLFSHPFSGAGSTFWPEVCTLFCMGTVLATLSTWTRSVYICIGLHAGWVWVMMLFRLFTENQGRLIWLYGPGEWISKGWIGPITALIIWAVVFATRKTWMTLGAED